MGKRKGSLPAKIMVLTTLIFAMMLFLVSFQYQMSHTLFSSAVLLSLMVPFLVSVNLILFLWWLLKRNKWALLPFLAMFLAFWTMGAFYKLKGKQVSAPKGLSVLSYNVQNYYALENKGYEKTPLPIVDFAIAENPDVVCLQESTYSSKVYPIFKSYPYNYVDVDGDTGSRGRVVGAIYSKYPIIATQRIYFPNSYNGAFYVDIRYGQDTIRIFNVHLQSFKIEPQVAKLQKENSARLLKRIEMGVQKQEEQASILNEFIQKSPHPSLIVGDLNSTQFSHIYRKIKDDFQDSYLESGKGFGRTYNLFGLPLRIDYILADSSFQILAHQNFDVKFSDHFPVMARLQLKPQQ